MAIYASHLPLILVFSLSFIIAFLIPIFASFPTYNDIGGTFLRLSSVLTNLTPFTTAVIVFSTLFSLLFLSFAIVAINVIVKHSRTQTRIRQEVVDGLEKYTGKVFVVLLVYTTIVVALEMLCFIFNISQLLSVLIALVIAPFFFYSPASIVIDEQAVGRSMMASMRYFVSKPSYVAIWFILAIVLLTLFDYLFITFTGTVLSRYFMLVLNSVFIMPILVIFQSQSYIGRFGLLKR